MSLMSYAFAPHARRSCCAPRADVLVEGGRRAVEHVRFSASSAECTLFCPVAGCRTLEARSRHSPPNLPRQIDRVVRRRAIGRMERFWFHLKKAASKVPAAAVEAMRGLQAQPIPSMFSKRIGKRRSAYLAASCRSSTFVLHVRRHRVSMIFAQAIGRARRGCNPVSGY